jgi:NADPH:quinone reductase-like Zn-dependent oxidoreductase
VFGWTDGGSYAEYACAPEDHFAPKPSNLSVAQAAAVPISGFAALQALRDVGQVQAGQEVLVIGAAGGGVVRGPAGQGIRRPGHRGVLHRQVELVRSIGADDVVDYTREDVTDRSRHWDLIVDTAGHRSLSQLRRALAAKGDAGDRRQ